MKKQFYRTAAATVLGVSLTAGMVAADNTNNTSHKPVSSHAARPAHHAPRKRSGSTGSSASNSNTSSPPALSQARLL